MRRIEDRAEIHELVGRYALAMDDRDLTILADLFTTDFELRTKDGAMALHGRDVVIKELIERFKTMGPSNHFGHDHLLKFDKDNVDVASGLLSAHAELSNRHGRTLIAAIRYEDIYRREQCAWRFSSRTASYFYFLNVDDYASALGGPLRIRVRGDQPMPADHPEGLESWRRFYG